MNTLRFHCHTGDDLSKDFHLNEWPMIPFRFDKHSKEMRVGLNVDSDQVVVQIYTQECRDIQVVRISSLIQRVLLEVFHKTPHVYRLTINKAGSLDRKSMKALTLITIKKLVPRPIYLLVIDNTSNFYIGFTMTMVLQMFYKLLKNKCGFKEYVENARSIIRIDETFETQYIMQQSVQTHSTRVDTNLHATDDTFYEEYELGSDSNTSLINARTRRENYAKYLEIESEKRYPNTFDGTIDYFKGVFLKIKSMIGEYERLKSLLNKAVKDDKFKLLDPNSLSAIKKSIVDLEDKNADLKCVLCVSSYKNCFLSECKHFDVCRVCVIRNRIDFNRFECSICRKISSFIITDVDAD